MSVATQHWLEPRSLDGLRRLNASALELLFELSRSSQPTTCGFVLPEPARTHLLQTKANARTEAARVPALLADLRFHDRNWWAEIVPSTTSRRSGSAASRVVLDRRLTALNRATLAFAWHLTQYDRYAAGILLGVSPGVAQCIGSLNFLEVERVADRTAAELRPRWFDRPAVWCQILGVPQNTAASRLARIQLLQLIDPPSTQ